jgi:hypothetical protein
MVIRNSMLFKLTAVLMVVLFPSMILADECREAEIEGEADAAAQHSSTGWFLGGVGSGLLLGLIGTGVITGAAAMTHPKPEFPASGFNEKCYFHGYSSKAKKKNVWSALGGGLAGTAIFVIIYASTQSD